MSHMQLHNKYCVTVNKQYVYNTLNRNLKAIISICPVTRNSEPLLFFSAWNTFPLLVMVLCLPWMNHFILLHLASLGGLTGLGIEPRHGHNHCDWFRDGQWAQGEPQGQDLRWDSFCWGCSASRLILYVWVPVLEFDQV